MSAQVINIIRPPDIVCWRTYILAVFLLLSFFRRLISEVAERNSAKIGHMVGSKCKNAGPKSEIPPLPTNRGPQNHLFCMTLQLNGNFNGLYLRNEPRCRQSVKCIDNYKVSPTSSKNVMNFDPQTASNSTCIFTHLCKFRIPLHCQASQTEISKRNSTALCQTVDRRPL